MASALAAGALAALFLAAGGTPAPADEQPAEWEAVLRLQLEDNKRCRLDKILFVRETRLGGETGLDGRIRCIDGREYDFSRQRKHEAFDIRLCQPTVC